LKCENGGVHYVDTSPRIEITERKGLGHPDTVCDKAMDQVSVDICKEYTNCHVTIIAGTTPIIRNEFNVHMQLGTREIMYDIPPEPEHNIDK
jgi:S-adenosylmethionine synthetase